LLLDLIDKVVFLFKKLTNICKEEKVQAIL